LIIGNSDNGVINIKSHPVLKWQWGINYGNKPNTKDYSNFAGCHVCGNNNSECGEC
jgi:hypothetical protein